MILKSLAVLALSATPALALDLIEIRSSNFSVPDGQLPVLFVVVPCGFAPEDLPSDYLEGFRQVGAMNISIGAGAAEVTSHMMMLGQNAVYLADAGCLDQIKDAAAVSGTVQLEQTPVTLD